MTTFPQDLRYAVRRLARAPGFTGVAVLTLALGIGANTAMFSVIRSVLLAPLPYAAPERVATLWNRWKGWDKTWLSEPEVMDYRRQVKSFEEFAAYTDGAANLTGGTRPERVALGTVTANTFAALGVAPMLGRVFTAAEDLPGHDDVVVLGYGLWQRRFAGDPRILGQVIQLNGRSRVVLGVMPPGFHLPTDYATTQPTELWLPLALNPDSLSSRGSHYLYGVGRLRRGAALEGANAELKLVADQWRRDGLLPATSDQRTFAVAVTDDVFGKVRPALLVLLGAVAFLLLIACANVANLLLVRSDARQREIAVRSALGAGRRRIAAQLLVESVALAVLGAVVGAVLAVVGVKLLVAFDPTSIPRVSEVRVDGVVLAGTALLALATGVLFGAVPAVQASRPDLVSGLREGGRGLSMSRARQRVRRLLVVAEVAAAVVLVIGAGLMMRSFRELRRIDVGFSAERALSLRVSLPRATYADDAAIASFYEELMRRVRELPGVKAAGAVRLLPFTGEMGDWSISMEGKPFSPGENPHADWQVVMPGYFETVGMRLRRGRLLTESDRADAPLVAVINETMAKRYWPGEDALGKRFRLGTGDQPWATIVGIVADVRQNVISEEPHAQMYHALPQFPLATGGGGAPRAMTIVLRTAGDPMGLLAPVRGVLRSMDPDLPVSEVRTVRDVLDGAVSQPRFTMLLLAIFGGVALLLAAVGVYGIISYGVTRRGHEIGIRMALGAPRRSVLGMVVGEGAALALVGVALGAGAAVFLTRLLASLLYGVAAVDPRTFLAVPALLVLVAIAASWFPARRAARVDPTITLRGD